MNFVWFSDVGEKEYYERQFSTLRSFEEVDAISAPGVLDEEQELAELAEQTQSEFAMRISNYANIALLILKVICAIIFSQLRFSDNTKDFNQQYLLFWMKICWNFIVLFVI